VAEVQYRTVLGFVQFDVNEREYNGKKIQDALIQNVSGNIDIRVSIWPEAGVTAKRGDLIIANGKYTEREANGRTYRNLDARNILVFPGNLSTPAVVNALPGTTPAADEPAPF
jgi:hypothetical protein